ncbi:hypothetical protein C8F04DRAFT_1399886 [Mycena alexandri]|uniref:Uncharacterized protein n=1 Tax=Mycena alexandri TaxID=1745969 RepID=A0AAD6SGZ6_9AGAR|nr:hypothetical protein C8F04DRAFT_1399886 [Mycena alexandri]
MQLSQLLTLVAGALTVGAQLISRDSGAGTNAARMARGLPPKPPATRTAGAKRQSTSAGVCLDALQLTACQSDSDCCGGYTCQSDYCQPANACMFDFQCTGGDFCDGGLCQPAPVAECIADVECPDPDLCVNGSCTFFTCSIDSDCPSPAYCDEGVCASGE